MAAPNEQQQYSVFATAMLKQMENAARQLGVLSEKLSKVSLDRLNEQLKKQLIASELMTVGDAKLVKTTKDLISWFNALEDKFEKGEKIQEKWQSRFDKVSQHYNQSVETATKAADTLVNQDLKKLGISKEELATMLKLVPTLRAQLLLREKEITAQDRLVKEIEGLKGGIKESILGFASVTTSLTLFKKAVSLTYDEMVRLTNKGLLGAFYAINSWSRTLDLIPQEFEAIINANRSLVNNLGGGAKGVDAFGAQIDEARKGLEYLGRDSAKAAAQLIGAAQTIGITYNKKDAAAYGKALDSVKGTFKTLSGLFGDTPEEFKLLITQLTSEETYRRKLNGLNKEQLATETVELMTRVENIRQMGLTNEQLIDLNKRAGEIFNPRKNTILSRRVESAFASQTDIQAANVVTPQAQQEFAPHQAKLQELYSYAGSSGANQKGIMDMIASPEMQAALKARAKLMTEVDKLQDYERYGIIKLTEKTGAFGDMLTTSSEGLLTAEQKRLDVTKDAAAEAKKTLEAAGLVNNSFRLLAQAASWYNTVMNSSLAVGAMAVVAGFGAIVVASGLAAKALASVAGSGAVGNVLDKLGKPGKMIGMLGNLAKWGGGIGAAGATGYAIGTAISKGYESIGGPDSIGTKLYGMTHSDPTMTTTPASTVVAPQPSTSAPAFATPAAGAAGFADRAVQKLQGMGWTREQAIGIAANLKRESSGNVSAVGDSGKAYGLAQWHPDRQAAFEKWAGHPIQGATEDEQLGFVNYELRSGTMQKAGRALAGTTGFQDAANVVSTQYEIPKKKLEESLIRQSMAAQIDAGGQGQAAAAVVPVPQIAAGPSGTQIDELRKHTMLLSQLVTNTRGGKLTADRKARSSSAAEASG